ncbi:Nucleoporin NUP56 [Madurella fahalii]|uniref:Nucleoporin NUP56 n=1 Tax=Madurella fahalii TaxID=1157608 RepID=A0ABQ0GLZ7_9PEZI
MADDPHNTSDISDHAETGTAKEDAETTAARRELKQTSISERAGHIPQLSQDDKSASDDDAPSNRAPARRITPEVSLGPPREEALKEQISSPKKKRAHDELDENRDVAEAPLEEGASQKPTGAGATQSRTDRSEPEKKRPRDRQASASAVKSGKEEVEPLSASASPRSSMESTGAAAAVKTDKPQTSAAAYAASGFAKLSSSSTSPFGALGGSGKPSPFASASGTSFSSVLGPPKPAAVPSSPPKLSFGSKTAASPFAGLNGQGSGSAFKSSPFASAFGGSAISGPRITNFGKPGEALRSDKPAKPFGAPDSDAEGKSEGEGSGDEASNDDVASDNGEDKEAEREKDESKSAAGDDKKKPKLQKIVVDDGEGQEVTLFSARAKMYIMEKGVGWKERGGGMLKINVPKSTVDFDKQGAPDPSSFDASVLDDGDSGEEGAGPKNVRLIMRQDHTLRVILNTIVLPAMKFQLTRKLKAATVLFTAFEGGEARQVQMKLSEANATAFSQLVELIKKRLADV